MTVKINDSNSMDQGLHKNATDHFIQGFDVVTADVEYLKAGKEIRDKGELRNSVSWGIQLLKISTEDQENC